MLLFLFIYTFFRFSVEETYEGVVYIPSTHHSLSLYCYRVSIISFVLFVWLPFSFRFACMEIVLSRCSSSMGFSIFVTTKYWVRVRPHKTPFPIMSSFPILSISEEGTPDEISIITWKYSRYHCIPLTCLFFLWNVTGCP